MLSHWHTLLHPFVFESQLVSGPTCLHTSLNHFGFEFLGNPRASGYCIYICHCTLWVLSLTCSNNLALFRNVSAPCLSVLWNLFARLVHHFAEWKNMPRVVDMVSSWSVCINLWGELWACFLSFCCLPGCLPNCYEVILGSPCQNSGDVWSMSVGEIFVLLPVPVGKGSSQVKIPSVFGFTCLFLELFRSL